MDHNNVLISAETNQKLCVLKSAEAFQQFPPRVRHCESGGPCFYLVCTNLLPHIPGVTTTRWYIKYKDINRAPQKLFYFAPLWKMQA